MDDDLDEDSAEHDNHEKDMILNTNKKDETDEGKGETASQRNSGLTRKRRIATPGSLHLHPDLEGKYASSGNGG